MAEFDLPAFGWKPRKYQRAPLAYFEKGGDRAALCYARRHGKDELSLQITCMQSAKRVGSYLYMLPESEHVRRAIWNMKNPNTGRKRIDDVFPREMISSINEQQMRIELVTGSNVTFSGSDNFDQLVGGGYCGLVFSEYALADPRAWPLLSPMILENKGWALFQGTPRGQNHWKDLFEMAQASDRWFAQRVSALDTDVFTPEELEAERLEKVRLNGEELGNSMFRQEYYVSFEGAVLGAIYAHMIDAAHEEGRICDVPYDPTLPVETGFDLGQSDATSVWFVQTTRSGMKHVIDYLEVTGRSVSQLAPLIKEKGYNLAPLQLPHDGVARHHSSDTTSDNVLRGLGFDVEVVPRYGYDQQINSVRSILPRCLFDKKKTEVGLQCLKSYHFSYDDKRKILSTVPFHDWSSHGSSAFATYSLGMKPRGERGIASIRMPPMANRLGFVRRSA